MEFPRRVFCVLLLFVFCCSLEASSRRGGRRDSLAALQGELRALQEGQEEARGDLASLQRGVEELASLVASVMPEDCWAAKTQGSRRRFMRVKPPGLAPREVLCDQLGEGGGWTVLLARYPTSGNTTARQDFNRTWAEYRDGFGDLHGEFWLGNEVLHALTNQAPHQLYVFLEKWNGNTAKGFWNYFKVGSEAEGYRVSVSEYQESASTTGDSFSHHHSHAFSTHDRDNDADHNDHCARSYGGGWWYFRCHMSHLTGAAVTPGEGGPHAITWRTYAHNTGLKTAYMRIRPTPPLDATACPSSVKKS